MKRRTALTRRMARLLSSAAAIGAASASALGTTCSEEAKLEFQVNAWPNTKGTYPTVSTPRGNGSLSAVQRPA